MNKRELMHSLIDRLMDIEETSSKITFFEYSGHVERIDVSIGKNIKAYSEKFIRSSYHFNSSFENVDPVEWFNSVSQKLDEVSMIPDAPVENMIEVRISESRAKELGLIA